MSGRTLDVPVWRTVTLGSRRDGAGYLSALEDRGITVGRVARRPVSEMPAAATETVAKLVRISSADLGLPGDTPIAELCREGVSRGFSPCRPEVAPALREQYPDQPAGEVLWLASEPISAGAESGFFAVGHDTRGRWLCLGCGGLDCWWGRMRRRALTPRLQERVVPMALCECAWSRRGAAPVLALFERP
jgi:hypothetical protein